MRDKNRLLTSLPQSATARKRSSRPPRRAPAPPIRTNDKVDAFPMGTSNQLSRAASLCDTRVNWPAICCSVSKLTAPAMSCRGLSR